MSLFKIFDVAGSGLSAQNVRLNLTSSNIANAESVASDPSEAYKSRHPIFETVLRDNINAQQHAGGVKTSGIVESTAEHTSVYNPNHPMANEDGYIYHSNVNIMEEMTNMIEASRSYQNNIEVLNTSKELILRTLQLGQ